MLDPSIIFGTNQVPAVGGTGLVASEELETARQQAQEAEARAMQLALALDIQSQLDTCRDFDTASVQAARMIAETVTAGRIQIAWRDHQDAELRIVADTDHVSETNLPLVIAAAEEISARGCISILPNDDHSQRHALLAAQQYAASLSAAVLIGAPLTDGQGRALGAVLAINPPSESVQREARVLDLFRPMLSRKFTHFQSLQPRPWERAIRSLTDSATRRGRWIAGIVAAVFCAAMLVPVRYNVPAACELQPVHRRYVAAPFDGPLEKVLVRPGDVVQEGDTIARINPREIEYKLAGLRADLKRAEQEKKGLVADHDFGGSKIAGLEAQRIQLETELLQYQRDNLEIRSPLGGIVVAGDLETSEGAPMTKGETLFEIAPLGEMIVEVAVGEEDLAYVRPGMEVEFYLHALPGRTMTGTLKRIHPQAELRDHDNVFVGEVHVTDSDGVLRPGMKGRSWVRSDRHALGWNLFHKAYFAVCRTLGW